MSPDATTPTPLLAAPAPPVAKNGKRRVVIVLVGIAAIALCGRILQPLGALLPLALAPAAAPWRVPLGGSRPPARAGTVELNFMQAREISVGQVLPDPGDLGVEVVTDDCAFDDTCALADTADFTKGRTVLIGMPGAFTPTCTDAHLPGFLRAAKQFRKLGVKNLAVVTTNDRFIMTAWKRKMRECMAEEGLKSMDTEMKMLADKGANFIKALGFAYADVLDKKEKNQWLQFNAGVRSQRFALVVEDGVVRHVAVDPGTMDLETTSAESILAVLKPKVVKAQTKPSPTPKAQMKPTPKAQMKPTPKAQVMESKKSAALEVAAEMTPGWDENGALGADFPEVEASESTDQNAALGLGLLLLVAALVWYYTYYSPESLASLQSSLYSLRTSPGIPGQ